MPRSSRAPISFAAARAAAHQVAAVEDRIADTLPVASIEPSPRNPRQHVDGIEELAASMRAHGLLQPIVVRPNGKGYELIAGHRRLEAAKLLGWTEIAAVVRDEPDDQAYILTLVENLQRENLQPKEEAAGLEVLVRERGWSTRQVGEAIKRSHIYVSRRLRVFEDPVLAPVVLETGLAVSTAEELLRATDADTRQQLATQAAVEHWTPAQARHAVQQSKWNESFHESQPAAGLAGRIRALYDELAAIEPATLSEHTRRELRRLARLARSLAPHERSATG